MHVVEALPFKGAVELGRHEPNLISVGREAPAQQLIVVLGPQIPRRDFLGLAVKQALHRLCGEAGASEHECCEQQRQ